MKELNAKAGDIIKTKKKHPCGSDLWKIIWMGADVKIKCNQCGRVVVLTREVFNKRAKDIVQKNED